MNQSINLQDKLVDSEEETYCSTFCESGDSSVVTKVMTFNVLLHLADYGLVVIKFTEKWTLKSNTVTFPLHHKNDSRCTKIHTSIAVDATWRCQRKGLQRSCIITCDPPVG